MLISEKLLDKINEQIGNEFGAGLEYVSIAAYFESEDMLHLAQVFFDQAEEERMHAMKFVRFVLDAGGKVEIPAIPAARTKFKDAADAVQAALTWEETVTQQINGLMDIAVGDKDYISQQFLAWFVTEQLEEISKMSTILTVLKRAGDNLLVAETYITDFLAKAAGGQAAAG
ncbi:MAG: ferritin [Chloroflexi bacterium]|nr:ferritin [Chloroflexota bacterium]